MRAMQMAGAADKVLATAVEYSKQRVQFGRPISTFQAIQHMLAELASCVAATIASAEAAARDADEGGLADGGRFSIAAAKSQASDFAQRIAAIAHQSMGAMGFTHEHILHHYTRRLWVWRRDFGSESFWGEKIGDGLRQGRPAGAVAVADGEQERGVKPARRFLEGDAKVPRYARDDSVVALSALRELEAPMKKMLSSRA